jgi:hypothetical protein
MRSEAPVHHQNHQGDEDAQSQCCIWNPHRGGRGDWEGCNLSPDGPWPKVFGRNMHDAHFQKHFWTSSNVIKYDGKTNLACRVDDDLFIIQFLPIYLADLARAWLDHLPRNMIDNWKDLKEIFTSNFQGMYVRPSNHWDLKSCRQKFGKSL